MQEQDTVRFEKVDTASNVNLFHYRTAKFKSVMIKVFLTGSLGSDVEEQAILPAVLKRGCRGYPSLRAISQRLEQLYGGKLSMDTFKLGEKQIFVAMLDMVNERLLPEGAGGATGAGVLEEGSDLLGDILTDPLVRDGAFLPELFEVEKRNLASYIESQINDKATYANIRLVEEMFRGQPFATFHWGRLDEVRDLDPGGAYDFYGGFMRSAPADVYMLGDISRDDARALYERILGGLERQAPSRLPEPSGPPPGNGNVMTEEQSLEQSKLAMGFNVDVACSDELYYALFFYNAILGGGSFSKLFKTVREKESLAYYASSLFDKHKGFLRVVAGIHRDRLDKVMEIVGEQMNEIAAGRISDEEFLSARKLLLSGLRAVKDSPGQFIDYDMVARQTGRETRIDRIAGRIEGVEREHVAAAAGLVTPGMTFFLKGTAG